LAHVPMIGRFARATEIGASAVSKMASLFGYTNVPVITDVAPFQPMNAPFLASAQIGTPLQKLALDPKQELSIDPSLHGFGSVDELAIANLKSKESYFGATSWATSDPAGTLIFNCQVTPTLNGQLPITNTSSFTAGTRVWHTPLSWLSSMFTNWRGDIIIRCKIVCTKFHKGRLKISYDPVYDIGTNDPPENSVYTQILDIGENDDVEFRIPYHQALAWLNVRNANTPGWSPGLPSNPSDQRFDNGMLTVRVLTALTAPVSGSVGLLFFVRGADNFELANPSDRVNAQATSGNQVPSFFALQAEDTVDVVTKVISLGPPAMNMPERYGLNFGECVSSLRTLLHRASVIDIVPMTAAATGTTGYFQKTFHRMPYTPGYDPSMPVTTAPNSVAIGSSSPYSFNNMHIMPYVASPFVGYRGSTNVYVTPVVDRYGSLDDARVSRVTTTGRTFAAYTYGLFQTVSAYGASASAQARALDVTSLPPGPAGMATTSNRTNATLTFNLPDYNGFNFSLVNPSTYLSGSASDGTDRQGASYQATFRSTVASDNNQQVAMFVSEASAGPDFTCLYFLCVPTMDYVLNIPVPP
jgi:hypothetical protein